LLIICHLYEINFRNKYSTCIMKKLDIYVKTFWQISFYILLRLKISYQCLFSLICFVTDYMWN
jgi:hypothetical protein